ncbi:MAG: sulfatase [Acidobacteriota bacterium]
MKRRFPPWLTTNRFLHVCTLGVVTTLVGCLEPAWLDEQHDLIATFPHATVDTEMGLIDFGTPAARPRLGAGWSWDEANESTTYVWGTGDVSTLDLYLSAIRDLDATITGSAFRDPGAPRQEVTVVLNDEDIATLDLSTGDRHDFRLPAETQRRGRNTLELQYAYARAPANVGVSTDRRQLAVAWQRLEIRELIDVQPPRIWNDELFLPFGSEVHYHFELPGPGSSISVDTLARARGEGALEATWRLDDGTEVPAPWTGEYASTWFTPDIDSVVPIRLTLRAIGDAGPDQGMRITTLTATIRQPSGQATLSSAQKTPSLVAGQGEEPRARHNVVVYLVDTLRSDRLGCYGGPSPSRSPRLDAFAEDAVLFTRAVAQTSWTKPAVASVLTGLGPMLHGVNTPDHALPDSALTLAEMLQENGYRTGGFVTNAHITEESGFAQGFEHFNYRPLLADDIGAAAIDWLDQATTDQPFFLYLHTIDPHAPFEPKPSYRNLFAEIDDPSLGSVAHIRAVADRGAHAFAPDDAVSQDLLALYDAEIAQNDAAFGDLLDALDSRGLSESTIVVFLSDHGEAFFEHGVLGHGWDLYRETLDVPLLMRVPDGPRGTTVDTPVQHIDLAPTLLGQLGISLPTPLEGRDLGPLLMEHAVAHTPLHAYLTYEGRRGASVIYRGKKLIEPLSADFAAGPELYTDRLDRIDRAGELSVWTGLLRQLGRAELNKLGTGLTSESDELDEERRRQLEALGYL